MPVLTGSSVGLVTLICRPIADSFTFRVDSRCQLLPRIRLREEADGEDNASQRDAS